MGVGIPQDKSLNIGVVKINRRCFNDFVRGVFDGDGSVALFDHPESSKKQIKYLKGTLRGKEAI